jgi:hypothetical protein
MRILVSGATGLIGTALVPSLEKAGHDVRRLSRTAGADGRTFRWDPGAREIDQRATEGVDAVVHLAGANVAEGRWTDARKRELRDSRVESTRLLVDALARSGGGSPRVFVSASGVGYYGDTGDAAVGEDGAPGAGFLAELCRDWEAEAVRASDAGMRVVLLRTGAVLSSDGGAIAKLLRVFRRGLGGPAGSGDQWMSWISIDDMIRVVNEVLGDDSLGGPINATAPGCVRNRDFTAVLGRLLERPARVRAPAFGLRLLFGQMADETILASTRAEPRKLLGAGFEFLHPDVETALRAMPGLRAGGV